METRRITQEEIVRALECAATPGDKDCSGCPYRIVEEGLVPGKTWESCDVDRIALDAAKILKEMLAQKQTGGWIDVEKRPTEMFRPVIVCRKKNKDDYVTEQGCGDVNGWWKVYGTRTKNVTHWMALPEPPERGD